MSEANADPSDRPGVQDAGSQGVAGDDAGRQAPPSQGPADESSPEPVVAGRVLVRRRRAPRYRAFGITGAAVGVVAGIALAFSQKADDGYSMSTIAGYLAVSLGMLGALIALGIAVTFDRHR